MRTAGFWAAAVIMAGPAMAQDRTVRTGPVPAWVVPTELLAVPTNASGAVFMRRQVVQTRLDDGGEARHIAYRVRILHANALQLGNLAIGWNPSAGAPIVHNVTVYRDGAATDVLKTAAFEVLRREDQLEAAKLDGTLTGVLRVADLRVGDELDVSFTTFGKDPTMGNREAGIIMLGAEPPAGRYHLRLSWPESRRTVARVSDDLAGMVTRGAGVIDLRVDNPAGLAVPKDAPPRYAWQRVVQYSDFADWPALSRHFAPLYVSAARLGADSPVRREAARIKAAHATAQDRAAAALKLVQQDVRYIYVGLNGGNLTPASADETWQRRYGDCKGKTALLLSLLAEMGIEAQPVLVNAAGMDDGIEQRLPLPQLFDHVLVRAQIDGVAHWLDGTLPPVAAPAPRPVLPVRWVLPLTTAGAGLLDLGWRPAAVPDEITLYEIDARAGFDVPARIVSTSIIRGMKGLQQQVEFSAIPPAQLLSAFRQQLVGDQWQAIEAVTWRYDSRAGASIVTIAGTGDVDWDNDGAGKRSMALPRGGFSPPDRRGRSADQPQGIPFYTPADFSCFVTTVRLPTTTQPTQWAAKAGFDTRLFGRHYHRRFDLRDGAIRMVRASRIETREIDPAAAARDNGRIAAFDNSMGYVDFDPTRRETTLGSGVRIPATYEGDWTADEVPCGNRAGGGMAAG